MTRHFATLLVLLSIPVAAQATATPRLCVSSASEHHKNIHLAEISGRAVEPLEYSVQIDDGPIVQVLEAGGFEYTLKDPRPRIRVKIRNHGSMAESFWLRLDRYESRQVCLWFKPLYHTWSVWPLEKSRHLCDCDD